MNNFFEMLLNIIGLILMICIILFIVLGVYYLFNNNVTILVDTNYCIEKINDNEIYKMYKCNHNIEKQELGNNIIHFNVTNK